MVEVVQEAVCFLDTTVGHVSHQSLGNMVLVQASLQLPCPANYVVVLEAIL